MRSSQPSQSASVPQQGQQPPQLPTPQFQQRIAQVNPYEQQMPLYLPPPIGLYGNRQQFVQPAMYYYPPPYGPTKSMYSQDAGMFPRPTSPDLHSESRTVPPVKSAQTGVCRASPPSAPSTPNVSDKKSRFKQPPPSPAPKVAEPLMGDLSGRLPFPIDFHRPPGCFDILQRGRFPRTKFDPNFQP
jgi:hypothetical protein